MLGMEPRNRCSPASWEEKLAQILGTSPASLEKCDLVELYGGVTNSRLGKGGWAEKRRSTPKGAKISLTVVRTHFTRPKFANTAISKIVFLGEEILRKMEEVEEKKGN